MMPKMFLLIQNSSKIKRTLMHFELLTTLTTLLTTCTCHQSSICQRGWSGGAMVLGKLPVPARPTIWIIVGQGPTALAVFYPFLSFISFFSLSLGDGPI